MDSQEKNAEPEITAHFDQIHEVLLREINAADRSIVAAVAWFTDREILDSLRKKLNQGVSVRIAITDDAINRPPTAPAFDAFIELGGEIHRIRPGTRRDTLMHHKFCVIDEATVVSGSYNWTRRARMNAENVTVVRNHPSFAARFVDTFHQLVGEQFGVEHGFDTVRIRKRLELIRNLIQLGETSEVPPHIDQFRNVADEAGVRTALDAIDSGDYVRALEAIEHWISQQSSLIVYEDADVPYLRLRLQALEYEMSALSAELADLERRLVVFNRVHEEALGGLIEEVLWARAELARLQLAQVIDADQAAYVEAEEAAESARQQFNEYSDEHHRLLHEPMPIHLEADDEQELKYLYRLASRLCHPDKVTEEHKTKATKVFQDLVSAYQSQDIERVRQIYIMLKESGLSTSSRSTILKQSDRLRAAIAQVNQTIMTIVNELLSLKESSAVKLMSHVGNSESAFSEYVEVRRKELNDELAELQCTIRDLSTYGSSEPANRERH